MRISIKEYRKLMNDDISSDDQIRKRIQYLEAFCRNIIQIELKNISTKH